MRVRTIYSGHDEANLCSVRGACKMGIDLLGLVLVQGNKTVEDIIAGGGIVGSTFSTIRLLMLPTVIAKLVQLAFIVREIVLHGGHREFLLEAIDFIEEQDDRSLDKPTGVAD